MKNIVLTKGFKAIVDDDDFEFLNQWSWHYLPSGGSSSSAYAARKPKSTVILMHRLIKKPPPGLVIDHINGDTLDNRKSNLRICTQAQNTANGRGSKNSTSSYKGVSWDTERSRWAACICPGNKKIYLGRFRTQEEAALAYNEAAKDIFGEFARLNELVLKS